MAMQTRTYKLVNGAFFVFLLRIISKGTTRTAMCKFILYIVKTQKVCVFFKKMISHTCMFY